jgi:hypothetical protein
MSKNSKRSRKTAPPNKELDDGEREELAKSVKKMMRNGVTGGTRNQYGPTQLDFVSFCFKNNRDVMNATFVEEAGALDDEGNISQKHVQERIEAQLKGEEGVLCPLDLLKVSDEVVGQYLLFRAENPRRPTKDNEPISDSTVNGWSSAIKNLFSMFNILPPEKYDAGVSKVKKGYSKETTSDRLKNGEGKDALPFDLLCWLSQKMLGRFESIAETKRACKEFAFARVFALLQWNLMCRSSNAEDISYSHLQWKDDSLLLYFRKQKNDQDGSRSKHPRHIYANPVRPEACPILALGMWLLLYPPSDGQVLLFQGGSQAARFNEVFRKVLLSDEVKAELMRRGFKPDDFGSHSIRKGASSFTAGGTTDAPPQVSIILRGGWTLSKIEKTYFRFEKVATIMLVGSWLGFQFIPSSLRHFHQCSARSLPNRRHLLILCWLCVSLISQKVFVAC